MTRRVIQLSGAARAIIASIAARKPSVCDSVRRAERPPSQSPNRAASALASFGASRARSIHSSGLTTLDERANVSRVNRSRRSALMRASMSSSCNSIARAERRSASSASCFSFSAASSGLAESVTAGSFDFGVSSARRLAEASRRGDNSTMTACSWTANGSPVARSWIRSALERLSAFSAVSMSAMVVRAESRVWRVVSSPAARAGLAAMSRAASSRRKTRMADKRSSTVIRRWRRPSGKGPWPRYGRNRSKRRFDANRSPWSGKMAAQAPRLC